MSNTARKTRKAARRIALAGGPGLSAIAERFQFQHPTKVGTPLADRAVPFTWKRRNGGMIESVGTRAMQRKRRRALVTREVI